VTGDANKSPAKRVGVKKARWNKGLILRACLVAVACNLKECRTTGTIHFGNLNRGNGFVHVGAKSSQQQKSQSLLISRMLYGKLLVSGRMISPRCNNQDISFQVVALLLLRSCLLFVGGDACCCPPFALFAPFFCHYREDSDGDVSGSELKYFQIHRIFQ
jgi:hypothetical protein